LFGQLNWGLGFVVHPNSKTTNAVILSHHSFGGSHIVFVPERKIVFTILVSHLTIEREFTKKIVKECCEYLDLSTPLM